MLYIFFEVLEVLFFVDMASCILWGELLIFGVLNVSCSNKYYFLYNEECVHMVVFLNYILRHLFTCSLHKLSTPHFSILQVFEVSDVNKQKAKCFIPTSMLNILIFM